MTKRTLLIIIALLVIVDIVAAFWYLSARLEASGAGFDIFNMPDDRVVTAADTIIESTLPDTFVVMEKRAYFISTSPAVKDNPQSHFTSAKHIKVRWPQSVNGVDSIPTLHKTLLDKMFGFGTSDINIAINQATSKPTFNSAFPMGYRSLASAPPTLPTYSNTQTLLVYPLMTSFRMLVMAIDDKQYNGIETQHSMRFVHYDRNQQVVITANDIFAAGSQQMLLGLINSKIDALNREKNYKLNRASQVPAEFSAYRKGINFHFPAGTITVANEGETEIYLDYTTLQPVFTPSFKQLVKDNGGYWDYKRLTIE